MMVMAPFSTIKAAITMHFRQSFLLMSPDGIVNLSSMEKRET
jgi:hypothetical protein